MPRQPRANNSNARGPTAGGSGSAHRNVPVSQEGMSYEERIAHCTQFMVHASKCTVANCTQPSCSEMKRFVQHNKTCGDAWNGRCAPCKKGILVCMYHSKTCRDLSCEVPHCLEMRADHPELVEGTSSNVQISQLRTRRS